MSISLPTAEVFRGMWVEMVPLRLDPAIPVAAQQAQEAGLEEQQAAARAEAAGEGFASGREAGLVEGRAAGREEGLREGLHDAESQVRGAVEQAVSEATRALRAESEKLQGLRENLQSAFTSCVLAAEEELLALCYETVCRVLGQHALEPAVMQSHLRQALHLCRTSAAVVLHVHPQDAELLAACADRVAAAPATSMRCVADSEVELGGFIVHAEGGGLDARLETALLACKEALLATRRERGAPADPITGAAA
ncbi:MAG: flagellar assembly protein FliH [Ramlibacter sp.]|jgi:flagellar assembly protein FliH|nr:flagellar assembly protein FliH [Ramlibacter sp.]